jgi:hypothetical protein
MAARVVRRTVTALACTVVIAGAVIGIGPVYAATLSQPPPIPCCGTPPTLSAATAPYGGGHYILISANSSGWVSGGDVYLWYYVVDPSGGQSQTYPVGSCRPSGNYCDASTTYYAGYCAETGVYHVYVWGRETKPSLVSNTADPTFEINTTCQ